MCIYCESLRRLKSAFCCLPEAPCLQVELEARQRAEEAAQRHTTAATEAQRRLQREATRHATAADLAESAALERARAEEEARAGFHLICCASHLRKS